MKDKSIIIIGAGVAGMSAGCYGQMNGYKTRIFEAHSLPGGLCTSWKRKGYTIDGCIHWLVGSGPGKYMNYMWEEVGAVQGKEMVNHEEFLRVVDTDGKTMVVYTNADRFEAHLKELAPGDAPLIHEICNAIRKFSHFDPPSDKPGEISSFIENIKSMLPIIPYIGLLQKYSSMTVVDLAMKFKDPFLQKVFPLILELEDMPALGLLFTLGWLHADNAGYPIGGSLEFSRGIEKRYLQLGGEIRYNQKVAKILVEDSRAVGIRLETGEEFRADMVISAADGHKTIFGMLDGRFINEEIKGYFDTLPIFDPLVLVSIGVNQDFSTIPHMAGYILDDPIEIGGQTVKTLGVKHYCYDQTLAPQGKSVIEVMFSSSHKYWKDLMAIDPERYDAEKKQIASTVISMLEKRYKGFTESVEMVDVATPLTFERYTGNWQGSFEGWRLTRKTMMMSISGKGMKKTLPGLDNFYMAGQWVEPGGGLPTGVMSARSLIQVICHSDGRKFVTSKP